jgi:hypothetical protein
MLNYWVRMLLSAKYYLSDQIKNQMGRGCRTPMENKF